MPEEEVAHQDQPPEEERARQEGWKPKEEWKGPPEKWLPAEAFNAKGEQIARILSVRTKKQEELLARQAAKLEELTTVIGEFRDYHASAIEQERAAHKAEIERLKAEKAKADHIGDFDAYKDAERKIRDLEAVSPPPQKQRSDARNPDIDAFIERNQWFSSDPEMNAAAVMFSGALEKKSPSMSLAENLTKTEAAMRRMFPEKFENPRRSQEQAVESGSIPASSGEAKKGYSSLPLDAKVACDRFVKSGILTQKQYVDTYFKQGAE